MPLLKRRRVLAAKVETTSGTAEALTSAEGAFNAYDVMIHPEIDMEPREIQGSFGSLAAVPGGYKGKATFKTDCGWDGTATEPSWADVLLPACAWVKSAQVFSPRSEAPGSNVKTLTIGCYLDGMFKSLSGCAGTFKLVCPTGKMAYIEWEFSGVWIAPTDVAIVSPTYPTALPLRYANSTSTWSGVALCVENITLDAGNEVVMRECAAANGYEAAIVVNRQLKVTANPETKLVATSDRYGQLIAMTEGTLTWGLDGPTNAVLTISAPKAQIVANKEGERNKMVIDELEWNLNQNGSTVDSDVTMTFTAAV
jgi:hypothetical protein